MEYEELIGRVLKGRSVNATAKALGIPQTNLDRYVKEQRMPDCDIALLLIEEAGVSIEEGIRAVAKATQDYKRKSGFADSMLLFGISIAGIAGLQFQQEIAQIPEAALIGGGVLSFCLYYVKYAIWTCPSRAPARTRRTPLPPY